MTSESAHHWVPVYAYLGGIASIQCSNCAAFARDPSASRSTPAFLWAALCWRPVHTVAFNIPKPQHAAPDECGNSAYLDWVQENVAMQDVDWVHDL